MTIFEKTMCVIGTMTVAFGGIVAIGMIIEWARQCT